MSGLSGGLGLASAMGLRRMGARSRDFLLDELFAALLDENNNQIWE